MQTYTAKDRQDMIEELEDVLDELQQVMGRIVQVENGMPDGGTRERLRQVRAQLEMAASDDHDWLGGSSFTLAGMIEELEEQRAESTMCACGHDETEHAENNRAGDMYCFGCEHIDGGRNRYHEFQEVPR